MRVLVDTNVLLRGMQRGHPLCIPARNALKSLHREAFELCVTPQNVKEFWNACTRPLDSNGFGLTVPATERHAQALEKYFTVLPDSELTYRIWSELVQEHGVSGVKVHDAYLAAAMKVHGVERILTFNVDDFTRYKGVETLRPETVK